MNFVAEGNIRAFKFGFYIAVVIVTLGIYNFIAKTFFDPCCQNHTAGEAMLEFGNFLSIAIGVAMLILIIAVFIRLVFNNFRPKKYISWKAEKESALNTFFIVILIINFCLLLGAQLPGLLIGCTSCDPTSHSEDINNYIKL